MSVSSIQRARSGRGAGAAVTFVEAALDVHEFLKTLSTEQRRERRRAQWRRYSGSAKGRERTRRYVATPKGIRAARRHNAERYLNGKTLAWRAGNRERVNAMARLARARRKAYIEEVNATSESS